jgi:hypothetical protein
MGHPGAVQSKNTINAGSGHYQNLGSVLIFRSKASNRGGRKGFAEGAEKARSKSGITKIWVVS